MAMGFARASELITCATDAISAATSSTDGVLVNHGGFSELCSLLRRTVPILLELTEKEAEASESHVVLALDSLTTAVAAAQSIAIDSSRHSRLYLILSSRLTARRLSSAAHDIARSLSLLPHAFTLGEEADAICDCLVTADFRSCAVWEKIVDKIDSAISNRCMDRAYANDILDLVVSIAGIPHDPTTIRMELDKLKAEVDEARARKDLPEVVQMNRIISFLARADATSSFREREERYFSQRNGLGNQPLEPLQPFLCPITRDVMEDPVETSLGQTFERSAIEEWFAGGHSTCPLTNTPLNSSDLRHNYNLKKSIEEWKERNTIITIANLKSKLESSDDQELLHCLSQLVEICKEDLHRDWLVYEDYLPVLMGLLERKEINCDVLSLLCILAKDSDDRKERFSDVEKCIELIVMCLGRRSEQRRLAVSLLLELSKVEIIRSEIGKVRGCIFLLVNTTNDSGQAASDAAQLLESLSFLDENIVQMAKANYFKLLLHRLCSGPDDVKKIMVTTLAETELTDKSKAALFRDGALALLLQLVSHSDPDIQIMTIKTLQNLSSLQEIGAKMITEGAICRLLDHLYNQSSSSSRFMEHIAATIMNIASSATDLKADDSLKLLESDDDIIHLFSLINTTVPNVQRSILQTFYYLCQIPSASIRSKLLQFHAVPALIPYCQNNDIVVRVNAMKLLSYLTENVDVSMSEEIVNLKCLETLYSIIKTSNDEEELISALGIISNLPAEHSMTIEWLLDGVLATIIEFLKNARQDRPAKNQIMEKAARALCRFTIPANIECQKRAARDGVISHLVQMLEFGSSSLKRYAAISLAQFSQNSLKLCRSVKKRWGFLCFSAKYEESCALHFGICSVNESFCLLEADAIRPLVRLLSEADLSVNEAALMALSTLVVDERLQSWSKVLSEVKGISPIINLLNTSSPELLEKTLVLLEKIFRLEEYTKIYGASAQMPLVDITQKGEGTVRALAAKTLAHLNVLQEQSSYF